MNSFIENLLAEGPVLTDGAWGTQLQDRGVPLGTSPDLWNLTHPHAVSEVARSYVEAGSRVVLTNTFGANRIALARYGQAGQAVEINRIGVRISRAAAETAAFVFGSIGPSGKMLAAGDVEPDALLAAFREQASALAESGAHALVLETMTDLEELKLAVRAAQETGLPVVACMVFDAGKAHDHTIMGVTPERAAAALVDAGVDAIGINCGVGAAEMIPLCRRLQTATSLPLWMKPNAGLPRIVDAKAVYDTSPEEFVANALALVDAGADFIGGCCGTSPVFLRALSQALLRRSS